MPERKPAVVLAALTKAYALAREKVYPALVERGKAERSLAEARTALQRAQEFLQEAEDRHQKSAEETEALKADFMNSGGFEHELPDAVRELERQRAVEERERKRAYTTPERTAAMLEELKRLDAAATDEAGEHCDWHREKLRDSLHACRIINVPGDAELGNWMVAKRVEWMKDGELIAFLRNHVADFIELLEREAKVRKIASPENIAWLHEAAEMLMEAPYPDTSAAVAAIADDLASLYPQKKESRSK